MSELLTIEFVAEMTTAAPNVTVSPDILAALGDNPMLVTLPVAKVGVKSRNGYTYTAEAVKAMAEQINSKRPEGRWGHLRADERATRYDPPAVRWLAAELDANGVLWAKATPVTPDAREHFRVATAARANVGTSIYGMATIDKDNTTVRHIDLESIDLADPARVGVPETVAVPVITAEMSIEEAIVPEELTVQLQELTGERDGLQAQVAEMQAANQTLLAEMEGYKARISELQGQLSNGWIETAVSEIKLPALRPIVAEQLEGRSFETREAAEAAVALIQEKPSIKAVAAELTKAALGPNVVVAAEQNANNWREEVVRAAESRAKKTGVLAQ